jgi:hypothetical protein
MSTGNASVTNRIIASSKTMKINAKATLIAQYGSQEKEIQPRTNTNSLLDFDAPFTCFLSPADIREYSCSFVAKFPFPKRYSF